MFRGFVGYLLVLVGGLVTSALPASEPVASWSFLVDLRAAMPGRMLGLLVVVTGLTLALTAWVSLVRRTSRGAPDVGLVLARRSTVVWCLPLLLAPPLFSRDGWSYAAQGELLHLGLSPYVWSPQILSGPIVEAVDPRWMDALAPYGPLPLVWGSAAAALTDNPWHLVVAHRLLSLVGLALLAYAVPRLAQRVGRNMGLASALVLASPLMLAHGIGGVHNDVLMAGLMACALVLGLEQRWFLAALLVGTAAAVKVPAVFMVVPVALASLSHGPSSRTRVIRVAEAGLVAVAALVVIGAVTRLGLGWLHALGVPGEVRTPLSLSTDLGLLGALVLKPFSVTSATTVAVARAIGSLVLVAVAVGTALRAPSRSTGDIVRAAAYLMTAVVVLSPVVHPWYALWCIPLLAAAPVGERVSSAVLHLSWMFGLVAPLDSSLQGAGVELTLTIAIVAIVAVKQLAIHRPVPGLASPWTRRLPATPSRQPLG